ncbi:MAG TPA: hypothetical protein VFX41_06305 [Actinomycetales bacterium]|nr:hypothetical protein [Actinomycetales bacterium]
MAPLSVVSVWAKDTISNTDRYVQTVSPLAEDPAVQAAVTNRITNEVFSRIDVAAIVSEAVSRLEQQGLPPQVAGPLDSLKVPVADGVKGFTHDQIAKIVASPQFAQAWDQANRVAHEQVVNVLSGKQGGVVSAQNGQVEVNLGPFVAQVKDRLVAEGFGLASRIPQVNTTVTIFQSQQITKLQGAYRLLNAVGVWLPVIAFVLAAAGVYVAKGHRRAALGAGLGVAGSMLLLGIALALARTAYLNRLPETVSTNAAASVFDTLVRFLRDALRVTLVAALVVALIAFLSGGSVTAVRTRGAIKGGIGRLRGTAEGAGLHTGRFGSWVYAHRRALRVAVVIVAAAVVTFWTNPTYVVVLVVAGIGLVLIGIIEFLAVPPRAPAPVTGGPVPEEPVAAGSVAQRGVEPQPPAGATPAVPTPRGAAQHQQSAEERSQQNT